jgi:hypothetical protein
MTRCTHEARELSSNELDVVSGGDTLGMVIDAAEKLINTMIFGNLIRAVHQPITSSGTSLHPQ